MFADRTNREDVVHFLNSAFACTGQREFYESAREQRVSIDFLHEYMLANYRPVYARALAAGVNHFNQSQIILRLLASGKHALPGEGKLIARALAVMPPQRAWKTLHDLRTRGVNNRRARAIARDYLQGRDHAFDCVKYRNKVKAVASHAHLTLPGEAGPFLFGGTVARFNTPLFEQVRKAAHSAEALYELPFTVAEGFAAKHYIPREQFLAKIAPRMTAGERVRLHASGVEADLRRAPLTKLALYALAQYPPKPEVLDAVMHAAANVLRRTPMPLGRVAAVLDNSYSTSGTQEKKRRPLAVAWAVDRLLSATSAEYHGFWTHPHVGPTPPARGATDLATPLLAALETSPDLVVIVSDAAENDPPGAAGGVLRLWRKRIDPTGKTAVVHLNPVFAAGEYAPKQLADSVPTVGLRDAESLPTALAFARYAAGSATQEDLERYLDDRVAEFLSDGGRGDAK